MLGILANLKDRASQKSQTAPIGWRSFSKLMQNLTGQTFGYDEFTTAVDKDPKFQEIVDQLIDNFDEQGFTLISDEESDQIPQDDDASGDAMIQSTAKRAAAKAMNKT